MGRNTHKQNRKKDVERYAVMMIPGEGMDPIRVGTAFSTKNPDILSLLFQSHFPLQTFYIDGFKANANKTDIACQVVEEGRDEQRYYKKIGKAQATKSGKIFVKPWAVPVPEVDDNGNASYRCMIACFEPSDEDNSNEPDSDKRGNGNASDSDDIPF